MPIAAAIIGGGLSLLGASEQASATESAANTSANAQLESARLAAEAAKFRPVGITTRFGKSNFQYGIKGVNPPVASDYATPEEFAAAQRDYQIRASTEGYLTGAGYELSPELRAYQDRLAALTGGALTQAEQAQQQFQPLSQAAGGLFGLGQQYLSQSPEQVASQYMSRQQDLLAPSRERQMAQLQNQLYQQGRSGLSVGATGMRPSGAMGLGATTPEMEAYYNAIAQQDAQLATQAQEAGQRNVAFGAGLFGTGANLLSQYQTGQVNALNPFTNYLGSGMSIEQMGQQPLTLGAGLGGQAAAYGVNAGNALFRGGSNAALTRQEAGGFSPEAGLLNALSESKIFQPSPFKTSAFSDSYQASIPVNNQSSSYY